MALKEISCYCLNECLKVQMDGKKMCDTCDLYGTSSCGGQDILQTGRNKKGYVVTENGLSAPEAGQVGKEKKRKKKK